MKNKVTQWRIVLGLAIWLRFLDMLPAAIVDVSGYLDWPLNASSLLSASAELLVISGHHFTTVGRSYLKKHKRWSIQSVICKILLKVFWVQNTKKNYDFSKLFKIQVQITAHHNVFKILYRYQNTCCSAELKCASAYAYSWLTNSISCCANETFSLMYDNCGVNFTVMTSNVKIAIVGPVPTVL